MSERETVSLLLVDFRIEVVGKPNGERCTHTATHTHTHRYIGVGDDGERNAQTIGRALRNVFACCACVCVSVNEASTDAAACVSD